MIENGYYLRDGTKVTAEEWLIARRRDGVNVAKDELPNDIEVSTIWLGIAVDGRIKHFETMVFGGRFDGDSWTSNTEEEALKMHAHVVSLVTKRK